MSSYGFEFLVLFFLLLPASGFIWCTCKHKLDMEFTELWLIYQVSGNSISTSWANNNIPERRAVKKMTECFIMFHQLFFSKIYKRCYISNSTTLILYNYVGIYFEFLVLLTDADTSYLPPLIPFKSFSGFLPYPIQVKIFSIPPLPTGFSII